uniref:Uncharacterized protein n=1 Tax=Arundo donax TaxID=35708 RepID=A0A0A9AGL1_ARUDO
MVAISRMKGSLRKGILRQTNPKNRAILLPLRIKSEHKSKQEFYLSHQKLTFLLRIKRIIAKVRFIDSVQNSSDYICT